MTGQLLTVGEVITELQKLEPDQLLFTHDKKKLNSQVVAIDFVGLDPHGNAVIALVSAGRKVNPDYKSAVRRKEIKEIHEGSITLDTGNLTRCVRE